MGLLQHIKHIFQPQSRRQKAESQVVPGKQFAINNKLISRNVKKITQRLSGSQHQAYLVGGGVRDLLLQLTPKDFDVATDATPEEVRKLFRNCRIIGRRFKLAHVYFRDEIIEVATFRAAQTHTDLKSEHVSDHGMILRDNTYGNLEQDAWRRDFTVNALYYDCQNDMIIDHTDGLEDITNKKIRIIGDAEQRYREDPVRMLRALRFAAKLDFTIEDHTEEPLTKLQDLLLNVPSARLFEEILKLFFTGHAQQSYATLQQYGFFAMLFPSSSQAIEHSNNFQQLLEKALENTDKRINQGKSINPAFLLAIFLWGPFQYHLKRLRKQTRKINIAIQQAADTVLQQQLQITAIPKRLTHMIREIWELQYRLPRRHGKRAYQSLSMKRFRAAYDFLLLRSEVEPQWQALANWWTEFQKVNAEQRELMVKALTPEQNNSQKTKKPD